MSGGYPRSCFGQRFYLAPSCDQIQTYRNAEFKREFGRACTCGRAQDCVPQASGQFLGSDQGRHWDQQRHGTKGNGWLAQNPCCNRAPKCLIYRTRDGGFSLPKTTRLWAVALSSARKLTGCDSTLGIRTNTAESMSKAAHDDQGKATTEPQSRACEGTNSREPGENQSPRGARRPQRIETEDLGVVHSSSMEAERLPLM